MTLHLAPPPDYVEPPSPAVDLVLAETRGDWWRFACGLVSTIAVVELLLLVWAGLEIAHLRGWIEWPL